MRAGNSFSTGAIPILQASVMENGVVRPTREGTLQGGSLSPLLANLVLDELDRELEERGLRFVRYADDCNVYVRSERAARRAFENITTFVEGTLKLKVNRVKSAMARPWERKLLGFCETPSVLHELAEWTRRRLRCLIWQRWKRGPVRYAELVRHGTAPQEAAKLAGSSDDLWHLSRTPLLNRIFSKRWFEAHGLPSLQVHV